MKRSKKLIVVCHCLLNSNAKIVPLADVPGAYRDLLAPYLADDAGIVQLPCPETCYLGMNRWGMTREQYDQPAFRRFCRTILEPTMLQLQAFVRAGYQIIGVAGMDGSPNCGINKTCFGYRGGELCGDKAGQDFCAELVITDGRGIFMNELAGLLADNGIEIPLFAPVAEPHPNHFTKDHQR